MPRFVFPEDFVWGCAAASYQIEGAPSEDGKGPSIWDDFCRKPGAIYNGDTGDVACDHYHRWSEDLDIIRDLGFKAYRFSVSWPRIFPEGRGAVNEKGLDFYERLVDGMLERGIQPVCTLYHWDLPLALEKHDGGWRSRETAMAYAEYASTFARRLGDRIGLWATFNEMPVVIGMGYQVGEHAPGAKEPPRIVRQVAHNLLVAHGLGVDAIRSAVPNAAVGIVHNPHSCVPFFETAEAIDLSRALWYRQNAWLLDPVFRGSYPEKEWNDLGDNVPDVQDGDMEQIARSVDFLGLNIYASQAVVHPEWGPRDYEAHFPRTDMDWPITPDVLYWSIRFAHDLYDVPAVYISENGCAFFDEVNREGRVEDYARLEYLRGYLRGVQRAASEGIPAKGYFVWSVMDNFEWAKGYSKRFGVVHVNFETQKRTPKASALWLSQAIGNNGF